MARNPLGWQDTASANTLRWWRLACIAEFPDALALVRRIAVTS